MIWPTLRERLLSRAIIDWETGCWNWSGHQVKSRKGNLPYGKIWRVDREIRTHVAAYELLVGPVPEGLVVHHRCENTLCLNPAHLKPTTDRENILLGTSGAAINARKTRCVRGHEFDQANTYHSSDGHRRCRACSRIRYARPKSGEAAA